MYDCGDLFGEKVEVSDLSKAALRLFFNRVFQRFNNL
jgi:hypothetical protein